MDRNDSLGSEDNREALEHVRNAEENRDALEAQARRTEATTPDDVADRPIQGSAATQGTTGTSGTTGSQGMSAAGQGMSGTSGRTEGSEDPSEAREHVHNAEENRDALEAQNRRVEETAPPETRTDLRDQNR